MTHDQPKPGDVWDRDGERREVIATICGVWFNDSHWVRSWCSAIDWDDWQSGATLVQRKEQGP